MKTRPTPSAPRLARPRPSASAADRPAWGLAIGGAMLGAVLALTVWAPARWLAWGVHQASAGQVQWLHPRGTVWQGSAQVQLSAGPGVPGAQALPGRLHWTLSPHWTGVRVDWQADCCMREASNLSLQPGQDSLRLQLSDHASVWPAALLAGLGAPWNTLQADGQLQLSTRSLQFHWAQGRLRMHGDAELHVQNVSLSLSPIKPIGSYRIHLAGTPEGTPTPRVALSTLHGPLMLSGQGQWVGQRLRFTGEASAQEGHEAAFDNLLNILGRRQGTRSLLSLG